MKRHTPTTSGGTGDGRLARLAAQVDRLDRQVNDQATTLASIRGDVDAHTAAITRLAETLIHATGPSGAGQAAGAGEAGDGTGGGSRPPTGGVTGGDRWPRDWMTVEAADHAVLWLGELAVWVRKVWSAYRPLPVCWVWHPVVVAELLAVQASWIAATAQDALADGLSVWHDRWQPGAAHRITRLVAGCERDPLGRHVEAAAHYVPDPAVLDEVAVWWATTHGTDPDRPAPGLTPTTNASTSSARSAPVGREPVGAWTRQETHR